MRTYISEIIPRIQNFSQKLDNLTLLTNQHWVVIDDIDNEKNVYIFRQNSDLLISKNGKVEKAKWEYLGHNSLLIDRKDESYLFKHGFFDENILALKIDSSDEYVFLVNESKFEKELNSSLRVIEFLNRKYIEPHVIKKHIEPQRKFSKTDSPKIEVNNSTVYNNDIIYIAPKYKIIDKSEEYYGFSSKLEKYIIEFEDNEKGTFYLKKKNNEAYFSGKPEGYWISLKFIYKDMGSCINALHYFLKTNRELSIGLLEIR